MKRKTVISLLFALVSLCFAPFLSNAQNVNSDTENKLFSVTASMWPAFGLSTNFTTSRTAEGGTLWSASQVKHTEGSSQFIAGTSVAVNATVKSEGPVTQEVSRITVNLVYTPKAVNGNIDSIILFMSENSDFSDIKYIPLDYSISRELPKSASFDIEDPKPNLYYKLVININSGQNDCIYISGIDFYGEEKILVPDINQFQNQTGYGFTISVPSGELHLLASNFALEDDEFKFKGNVYPASPQTAVRSISSLAEIATDTEDENWRNAVPASSPQSYTLFPNVSSNVYTKIRAKAVNGDKQSPELVTWINMGGILTSVNDLHIDANETASKVIWYDMLGRKIENPKSGLYIRVLNGKAEKIIL